jgi:hypothetical protein
MAMATACAGKCGPVANGCGTNYTCTCPTGQVCGGATAGACCTPMTKAVACAGKACGTAVDGCGGTIACDNSCVADAANPCGRDGTCTAGTNSCHLRASGTACGTPSCSGSTLTPAGRCNGSGTCTPGTAAACSGNLPCATATTCSTGCTDRSTGGCASGFKCVNGTSCVAATVNCNGVACPVANGGGQCCVTDPANTGTNAVFTCQAPGATCSSFSIIPCNGRAECPAAQVCCIHGNGSNPSHWDVSCQAPANCIGGSMSFGIQICDPALTAPSECLTGSCQDFGITGLSGCL